MFAEILKKLAFVAALGGGVAFLGATFGPLFAMAGCYVGSSVALTIIWRQAQLTRD